MVTMFNGETVLQISLGCLAVGFLFGAYVAHKAHQHYRKSCA